MVTRYPKRALWGCQAEFAFGLATLRELQTMRAWQREASLRKWNGVEFSLRVLSREACNAKGIFRLEPDGD